MAAPRQYPDDFRERAVRMVRARRQETGQPRSGVTQAAQQLGVNPETLLAFLGSHTNQQVTGQLIRVDGGL